MRSPKREALALLIVAAVLFGSMAWIWRQRIPRSSATVPVTSADPGLAACDRSETALRIGSRAFSHKNYTVAFSQAKRGLDLVQACTEKPLRMPLRGTLLAMKALSEHYLPNEMGGSSATDLNQATMWLTQCETDPDLYGTQAAAMCETGVDSLAKAKTTWDMQELTSP